MGRRRPRARPTDSETWLNPNSKTSGSRLLAAMAAAPLIVVMQGTRYIIAERLPAPPPNNAGHRQ